MKKNAKKAAAPRPKAMTWAEKTRELARLVSHKFADATFVKTVDQFVTEVANENGEAALKDLVKSRAAQGA